MKKSKKFVDVRPKVVLTSIIVISAALALTTLSENLTKGLMHGIINRDELFINLMLESLKYGLVPGIIGGFIINQYLRPFYIVTKNIFFDKEVNEQQKNKAIKVISNLDKVIILLNVLSFSVGIIIELFLHPIILVSLIENVITAMSTALVFGLIQSNIINLILSEPKSLLKIYSMDKGRKSVPMITKNLILIVALTFFISSNLVEAGNMIYSTEEKYSELTSRIISGEITLSQARNEYKEEKSVFLNVDKDEIIFPYDMATEEKPGVLPIYLIYFVQLLIISIVYQLSSSLFQKRQIKSLSSKVKELSNGNGDLTSQLEIINFDEMGELTENINIFIFSLRKMVLDIKNLGLKVKTSSDSIKEVLNITEKSTHDIVSANEQTASSTKNQILIANQTTDSIRGMLKSVEEISDNIETQASFVEQTSSAINEMAANIESVNETTKNANELSNNLVHVANSGGTAVNQSILAVKHVEEFSDKIISMVKVITDIADKTNLLAMNAAIEAAHAGESGKGFAVVAQEVRKLAEDSSVSAQQISDHIKEMIDLVNNGVQLSEGAGKALGTVSKDVKQTSQLIEVVSQAMNEQSAGTREVLGAISSLMDSTNSIKGITKAQQQRNKEMYSSIDELKLSFNQIAEATEDQSRGTVNIQKSVDDLKKVILDNEETTRELEKLLNGFVL